MRCACLQQRGGSLKHLPKHPLKKELKVTVSGIAINILDSWSHIRAKQPASVMTEAYNVNVKVA